MKFDLDPYRTPPAKLTSPPYPEIIVEGIGLDVSLQFGEIFGWLPLELAVSASVVSGELRQLLKDTAFNDGMSLSAEIQSGELRQLLKSYDIQWEALALSTEVQSGEFKTILIQYLNWDETREELAMSLSIVSGTFA